MTFGRLATLVLTVAVPFAAAQSLDFELYRTKVEPIFLKKREGHARCVVCHSAGNSGFRLEPLAAGTATYSEEQSRKNFEVVTKLINRTDPNKSRILLHPLAFDAGGDAGHSGGQQFESKDDPDWKILADWVRNAK